MDPWEAWGRQLYVNHRQGEGEDPWNAGGARNCCADPWTWRHRALSGTRSENASLQEG